MNKDKNPSQSVVEDNIPPTNTIKYDYSYESIIDHLNWLICNSDKQIDLELLSILKDHLNEIFLPTRRYGQAQVMELLVSIGKRTFKDSDITDPSLSEKVYNDLLSVPIVQGDEGEEILNREMPFGALTLTLSDKDRLNTLIKERISFEKITFTMLIELLYTSLRLKRKTERQRSTFKENATLKDQVAYLENLNAARKERLDLEIEKNAKLEAELQQTKENMFQILQEYDELKYGLKKSKELNDELEEKRRQEISTLIKQIEKEKEKIAPVDRVFADMLEKVKEFKANNIYKLFTVYSVNEKPKLAKSQVLDEFRAELEERYPFVTNIPEGTFRMAFNQAECFYIYKSANEEDAGEANLDGDEKIKKRTQMYQKYLEMVNPLKYPVFKRNGVIDNMHRFATLARSGMYRKERYDAYLKLCQEIDYQKEILGFDDSKESKEVCE